MSDLQCLFCEHGPHRSAPCTTCGCKNWVNAGVASARASVGNNNILSQEIPTFKAILVDILELLVEAFPEAAKTVDKKREEYRAKMEAERESQAGAVGPTEASEAATSTEDHGDSPEPSV